MRETPSSAVASQSTGNNRGNVLSNTYTSYVFSCIQRFPRDDPSANTPMTPDEANFQFLTETYAHGHPTMLQVGMLSFTYILRKEAQRGRARARE